MVIKEQQQKKIQQLTVMLMDLYRISEKSLGFTRTAKRSSIIPANSNAYLFRSYLVKPSLRFCNLLHAYTDNYLPVFIKILSTISSILIIHALLESFDSIIFLNHQF